MRSVSVSNLPGEENFGFEKDEELPNSPLVNNWVYIKIGEERKMKFLFLTLVICTLMKLYRYIYLFSKYSRMMRFLLNQMAMMWFKFEEIRFQKSQKSVLIQCI